LAQRAGSKSRLLRNAGFGGAPQIGLDAYGRRSGNINSMLSDWLRNTVGITDPKKPFYSHRHSFETFLRSASADPTKPCTPDIERYLSLETARKPSV